MIKRTSQDIRRLNRFEVLRRVYAGPGAMSRQDIATATGLSFATVANLTAELLEAGVLVEAGHEDSSGGRPRARLAVNAERGALIGVDIAETSVHAELFDLALEVRHSVERPLPPGDVRPSDVVDVLMRLCGGAAERLRGAARAGARGRGQRAGHGGARGWRLVVLAVLVLARGAPARPARRAPRAAPVARQPAAGQYGRRAVVRRRARGRRPGGAHAEGRCRRRDRDRRAAVPGLHQQRGRVGPHLPRARRPPVHLRQPGLCGGVREHPGDRADLARARARRRAGDGRGRRGRGRGPGARGGGAGPDGRRRHRQDRPLPGRGGGQPRQPLQPPGARPRQSGRRPARGAPPDRHVRGGDAARPATAAPGRDPATEHGRAQRGDAGAATFALEGFLNDREVFGPVSRTRQPRERRDGRRSGSADAKA